MDRFQYYGRDLIGRAIARIEGNCSGPDPSPCGFDMHEVLLVARECARLRATYGYDKAKHKEGKPIPKIGEPVE